jgi:hypothetical protein
VAHGHPRRRQTGFSAEQLALFQKETAIGHGSSFAFRMDQQGVNVQFFDMLPQNIAPDFSRPAESTDHDNRRGIEQGVKPIHGGSPAFDRFQKQKKGLRRSWTARASRLPQWISNRPPPWRGSIEIGYTINI